MQKRMEDTVDACSEAGNKRNMRRAPLQFGLHIGPAPFSHEMPAQLERESCDYQIKISLDEARKGKAPRKVRIYADGMYDMFHSGHARQLMQAKMAFPKAYLIVGVCSEESAHKSKRLTVMNSAERNEAVRHCRYVDEVVTDAPWWPTKEFIAHHKIDFVAHDDIPFACEGTDDVYKDVKSRQMFLVTHRTEGISTTDVIGRIIKDYDVYVRRNLSRGYSAKELNIGFMQEKTIQLTERVDKLKDKGREWKDKGKEWMDNWQEKSNDFVANFLSFFGAEGRLSRWMKKGLRAISPTLGAQEENKSSKNSAPSCSNTMHKDRISPVSSEEANDSQFNDSSDDDTYVGEF